MEDVKGKSKIDLIRILKDKKKTKKKQRRKPNKPKAQTKSKYLKEQEAQSPKWTFPPSPSERRQKKNLGNFKKQARCL